MSIIEIRNCGITNAGTDAVVNVANEQLLEGGGVCGIIFSQAGSQELTAACNKIGYCPNGSAVITPAFKLKAKYIIHAVGPIWKPGSDKVIKQLYGAYYQSLELAYDNGCSSIAFPLISAGIFGAPVEKSWRKGLQACRDFFDKHPDYDCTVVFTVPSEENRAIGFSVAKELGIVIGEDESSQSISPDSDFKHQKEFCLKYIALLQLIALDDELREWCRCYSVYSPVTTHKGLENMLHDFLHDAYDANIVLPDYSLIIDQGKLDLQQVAEPTDAFIASLSDRQIVACIAWHFRRDYFSEGSLISESIGGGCLLKYLKALSERTGQK